VVILCTVKVLQSQVSKGFSYVLSGVSSYLCNGLSDDHSALAVPYCTLAKMSVLFKHENRKYHNLEDKVVLISGGGSGMGEAIAVHLAQKGYRKLALVKVISSSFYKTFFLPRLI